MDSDDAKRGHLLAQGWLPQSVQGEPYWSPPKSDELIAEREVFARLGPPVVLSVTDDDGEAD